MNRCMYVLTARKASRSLFVRSTLLCVAAVFRWGVFEDFVFWCHEKTRFDDLRVGLGMGDGGVAG